MARIGLYFGSFNPIHIGHLIIGQYMINTGNFDKVRFVVSPQNPFKKSDSLLEENLRLKMTKMATENNPGFEVSDAEFNLPKPSFTIQTLSHFAKSEPENQFSIIIGSDQLGKLHEWKDIDKIAVDYPFYVYNRKGTELVKPTIIGNFHYFTAPYLDISATSIRNLLSENKSIRFLVPDIIIPLLAP